MFDNLTKKAARLIIEEQRAKIAELEDALTHVKLEEHMPQVPSRYAVPIGKLARHDALVLPREIERLLQRLRAVTAIADLQLYVNDLQYGEIDEDPFED